MTTKTLYCGLVLSLDLKILHFLLFLGMVMHDNESETNEIEPQHIHRVL